MGDTDHQWLGKPATFNAQATGYAYGADHGRQARHTQASYIEPGRKLPMPKGVLKGVRALHHWWDEPRPVMKLYKQNWCRRTHYSPRQRIRLPQDWIKSLAKLANLVQTSKAERSGSGLSELISEFKRNLSIWHIQHLQTVLSPHRMFQNTMPLRKQ
jgi:hypothetical protein